MEFEKVINERYSSRKFKSQKISKDQIEAVLHAAKVAPTAVNKQPFHIWVISSQDSLDKVSQTTKFTFGAPVIFVLGSKSDQAWVRKYDNQNFSDVDTAIVGTHMMLEIENQGLGTTWVAAFDAPKMKKLFPQMSEYNLIALFPTGYKDVDCKASLMHTKRVNIDEFTTYID